MNTTISMSLEQGVKMRQTSELDATFPIMAQTRPPIIPPQENMTYTFSPPHTIWGMDVEMFSYVFLAIGGIAPIIFILLVVIGMKCYTWSKLTKFEQYEERQRPGMELLDTEKHYQAKTKQGRQRQGYEGPGQSLSDEETGGEDGGGLGSHKRGPDYTSVRTSINNPNVYFKGKGTDENSVVNETTKKVSKTKKKKVSEVPKETSTSTSVPPAPPLPPPGPAEVENVDLLIDTESKISTEEQKALECFDKIYDSLDVSGSPTVSEGSPELRENRSANNSKKRSQSKSGTSQNLKDGGVTNTDLKQVPNSVDQGPGDVKPKPTKNIARSPSVKLKIKKPADKEEIEQRQSWLHTSFVNVAYEPDSDNLS